MAFDDGYSNRFNNVQGNTTTNRFELKILITYVIGCQAAIESILQANGITSHKKINALAIGSLKKQQEFMQQALCKLKEISAPKM